MLEKPVVLYMDRAIIDQASPDPPGACCAKCVFYAPEGSRCRILAIDHVEPMGVCCLFVGGLIPPEVAGYQDEGTTMCGNCTFFLKPSRCRIVAGDVEAGGCCNAWKGTA